MRDPRREIDPEHVWEVQETRVRRYSRERFHRLRFARRVLAALDPPCLDAVFYENHKDLRVERGREWKRPPGYFWATVGIPGDATREEIVFEMIRLAGAEASMLLVQTLLELDEEGDDRGRV